MAAAKHNITIEQGIDFTLEIQLKDATGAEIDLSAYNDGSSTSAPHFLAKIKRSSEVSTVECTFTTAKLATVSGDAAHSGSSDPGDSGRVALKLTDAQTLALTNTSYVYDLYRQDSANNWHRDLEGTVTVVEGVSR